MATRYSGSLVVEVRWREARHESPAMRERLAKGCPHNGYYRVSVRGARQSVAVCAPRVLAYAIDSAEAYDAAALSGLGLMEHELGGPLAEAERGDHGLLAVSRRPVEGSRKGRIGGQAVNLGHGRGSRSPTVWVLEAAGRQWRVRSSSLRSAMETVRRQARTQGVVVIGLATEPVAAVELEKRLPVSVQNVRRAYFDKVVRAWETEGVSLAEIARRYKLPRETVRDWVRQAAERRSQVA